MNDGLKNKLLIFEGLNMTPTNVVSMNFKDKASLDDFVNLSER